MILPRSDTPCHKGLNPYCWFTIKESVKKLRIIDWKYGDYELFFFYLQKLLQEGNGEGHRRAEHQQLLKADKAEELEQA